MFYYKIYLTLRDFRKHITMAFLSKKELFPVIFFIFSERSETRKVPTRSATFCFGSF